MRTLVTLLILLATFLKLYGTGQVGDILIWNGDTLTLFSNPLESYKNIEKIRPKLFGNKDVGINTACWRGYIAEWELIDNELYLINIYSCEYNSIKADFNQLFPRECVNGKLKADWVSERLFVPIGQCIEYIHMDYESIYEKEIELTIHAGILLDTLIYHNRIIRKPDNEYSSEFLYSNINWQIIPELKNNHIQVFVGVQPKIDGSLDSIDTKYTYAVLYEENQVISDTNNIYLKEAIRIARLIPEWQVIYRRHKILRCGISFLFDESARKKYTR